MLFYLGSDKAYFVDLFVRASNTPAIKMYEKVMLNGPLSSSCLSHSYMLYVAPLSQLLIVVCLVVTQATVGGLDYTLQWVIFNGL